MLNILSNFISENNLISKGDRLLLTVSGGKDSVCMAYLFKDLQFEFGIVHCNFKLRAEESDLDEQHVSDLAKQFGVKFYSKSFDTKNYAKTNKLSIQMAARDLRYQFFDEISQKHSYNKILTAHHSDDNVETLLIKKSRNSSLEALQGIPLKNGKIIRPMLCFNVQQIEGYIKENAIKYRLDKSNLTSDYQRNKLRHEVLPNLSSSELLQEIEENKRKYALLKSKVEYYFEHHTFDEEGAKVFEVDYLQSQDEKNDILYECLKSYGPFNWKDVFSLLDAEVGKQVLNTEYRLVRERNGLSLSLIPKQSDEYFLIHEDAKELNFPISLSFSVHNYSSFDFIKDSAVSILDFDKLHFPLTLRKWQFGDSFIPLGMTGTKKISDYLIDNKFSTIQKENTWVICSLDGIVCIVGERINESFKLVAETEKVYLVQPLKNQS